MNVNATADELKPSKASHHKYQPEVRDESDREKEILLATTNLEQSLLEWEDTPGADAPTWPFYEKAIALLKTWERGTVPLKYLPQLQAAENLFEALLAHFNKFQEQFTSRMPSRAFFMALQEYLEAMRADVRASERPALESPHDLMKLPHMTKTQCSAMLGISLLLLEKELTEPGSVITPDWVSPARQKEEEERRALSLTEIANASTGLVLRTCGTKLRGLELAGLFSNE